MEEEPDPDDGWDDDEADEKENDEQISQDDVIDEKGYVIL